MVENALAPAMPDVVYNFLMEHLKKSKVFLEYGCGGSTCHAAKLDNVVKIYSVDTDKSWVDKVTSIVSSDKLSIGYCDVGPIMEWGTPINDLHMKDFWRYMTIPWSMVDRESGGPDLVLVDGRFRVASFLYSLVCADVGTKILFDDYIIRPEYHVVEKYLAFKRTAGYIALFEVVEKSYCLSEICSDIARFSVISK